MNRASISIYKAGLFQGIALVAFPAVSTILTSPDAFHLTNTQYGSLFIPQAILSIVTALLNPLLSRYFGAKRIFLAGLIANFLSMVLLTLSAAAQQHHTLAYAMLIIATSCLGIGFGAVVPTINRMAEELYPLKSDSAVLTLNALLGVGTTLAPAFIALFTKIGFWWGLPLFLSIALFALMLFILGVEFPEAKRDRGLGQEPLHAVHVPALAYVFIAFAFFYGIVETLSGNWVSIYMNKYLDASMNIQSLALVAFWGMVTFGRVFFSVISQFFSESRAFQLAPLIALFAFIIIASLAAGQDAWAVIAFGLVGFGCSVLLPLCISFGSKQLKMYADSVPGVIIASYLLGYGVAAFGVGPLQEFAHMSLRTIYLIGALIAWILWLLSRRILKGKVQEERYG